jgi:hypothetical protein
MEVLDDDLAAYAGEVRVEVAPRNSFRVAGQGSPSGC